MTDYEIRKIYDELEAQDPEGSYASRATIFMNALNNGKITLDVVEQARQYYGSLWNYVGD